MQLQQKACGRLYRGVRRAAPAAALSAGRKRDTSASAASAVSTTQRTQYRVTEGTLADLQTLFQSQVSEYDYEVADTWVEGQIPKELRGTYFRNGPGLQVKNERYKRHTFDGDGQILSFAFEGGRCHFRNRFVRTQSFMEEQAAGRPLYRGAFTVGAADGSLLFNPFDFNLKNAANTNVLHWAGKLYAMYESGLPHEMDPQTLDTIGPSTLGGQLRTPVLGAHYRVETRPDGSRRWVTFSNNAKPNGSTAVFYEFAEDGTALQTTSVPLEGVKMSIIHDLALTENYYVLVVGPLDFNPTKFVTQYIFSRCSIADCLEYGHDQPTKVWLVPRPGGKAAGEQPRVVDAPPFYTFHHANAYELEHQGRPHLVLDTAAWNDISFSSNQYTTTPQYYQGGSRVQLRRLVFDIQAGRLAGCHQLLQRTMEFPSVNWALHGRPHTHIYCCGDAVDHPYHWGPSQALVKVSLDAQAGLGGPVDRQRDVQLQAWEPGQRCFVNEPLFVPRPGATSEDDGWVLVTVHNAATGKGDLAILDARDIARGPVATIHCPHFLPAALHGSFSDQVFGAAEGEAAPKWKEPHVWRAL